MHCNDMNVLLQFFCNRHTKLRKGFTTTQSVYSFKLFKKFAFIIYERHALTSSPTT